MPFLHAQEESMRMQEDSANIVVQLKQNFNTLKAIERLQYIRSVWHVFQSSLNSSHGVIRWDMREALLPEDMASFSRRRQSCAISAPHSKNIITLHGAACSVGLSHKLNMLPVWPSEPCTSWSPPAAQACHLCRLSPAFVLPMTSWTSTLNCSLFCSP